MLAPLDPQSLRFDGSPHRPAYAPGSRMGRALVRLVRSRRIIVVCGASAVGKSFVLQQLAVFGRLNRRSIHTLSWQSVRQQFASGQTVQMGTKPGADHQLCAGIGCWLRLAIGEWDMRWPDHEELLLIEAPLIHGQFLELAHNRNDRVESLLSDRSTRFVLVSPTRAVRSTLEFGRELSLRQPQHPSDALDCQAHQLSTQWYELVREVLNVGLIDLPLRRRLEFDVETHELFYAHILRSRVFQTLKIERLAKIDYSVHALGDDVNDLLPSPEQIDAVLRFAYSSA